MEQKCRGTDDTGNASGAREWAKQGPDPAAPGNFHRTHTMRTRTLTPLVALTLLLGACVTDQGGKQVFGTLAGAAAGGWRGSKIGGGT